MHWQAGKSDACHPKFSAEELEQNSKYLFHAHSESHWSTVETMKQFITHLMVAYFIPKVAHYVATLVISTSLDAIHKQCRK